MLNESAYHRQLVHNEQMHYMRIAFAGVMTGKKDSHKVKTAEKKLKPKRALSYDLTKDEEILDDMSSMEKYFEQTGKIKKDD